MKHNPPLEILFVDNIPGAPKDFAELISAKYKFGIGWTEDPMEAINIVKNNGIKVIVLDQKMPLMNGTELFKEIKKINPDIKTIMLSSEAESHEVGEALRIGFNDYLEKSNIKNLPDKVFEWYTRFEVDFAKKYNVANFPVIFSQKSFFSMVPRLNLHIINLEVLNENFHFKNKWETYREIHAGESKTEKDTFKLEEIITINENFEHKLKNDFNIAEKSLNLLKINITNEINKHFSLSSTTKKVVEISKEQAYKLPDPPSNLKENYIVKSVYERTPVYWEIKATMAKSCSHCGKYQPFTIVLYKQSKQFMCRQINIMNDNTKDIIDLGVTTYF